jgi:hypothetical protein
MRKTIAMMMKMRKVMKMIKVKNKRKRMTIKMIKILIRFGNRN